jgi:MFS family permease
MLKKILPAPGVARVLTLATLVNTVGNGLWMTSSALFLHRMVGLSVAQIAVGLTIAALVTMTASVPMGYLADRRGPRGVQIVSLVMEGVLAVGLAGVTLVPTGAAFPVFLTVSVLAAVADAGARGARGAVIGNALPADQRVRTRAYLRAVTNFGISVGALAAGVGLAVDRPAAYLALILGNAVTYLVAAAVVTRLPALPPVPAVHGQPRLIVLRDRSFLACTVLDGLMSIHFDILTFALPLWIASRTSAPAWLIAVLFLVNTSIIVLLQVRASRGTDTLVGAARASRTAGVLIALACLLFAGSAGVAPALAVVLLLAGALAHVLGELRQSAAGWGISFGLAPAHAQGQYQGAYAMGMQLGRLLAPGVLTALALGLGRLGWVLLALAFAGVGALVPPVVRWADRQRQREAVADLSPTTLPAEAAVLAG